jgi:hypothetical protein
MAEAVAGKEQRRAKKLEDKESGKEGGMEIEREGRRSISRRSREEIRKRERRQNLVYYCEIICEMQTHGAAYIHSS